MHLIEKIIYVRLKIIVFPSVKTELHKSSDMGLSFKGHLGAYSDV